MLAMLLFGVDMVVVSKEANSIHEMDFSNLLGFHHVVPITMAMLKLIQALWILISHSLRHVN
jgi:hypothetical protein